MEWENIKASKLSHKMALIVQMGNMYPDPTKRELKMATVISEMEAIESEEIPHHLCESSAEEKAFLQSLKATFEHKQPVAAVAAQQNINGANGEVNPALAMQDVVEEVADED